MKIEEIKELALENSIAGSYDDIEDAKVDLARDGISKFVDYAFNWDDTPEGIAFWLSIHEKGLK